MPSEKLQKAIRSFIRTQLSPFTAADFRDCMKNCKCRISLDEATEILCSIDDIFSLVNDRFLTRAGAFTYRWFSFKPTKEEVEAGGFVPGHRFMPFYDSNMYPRAASIITNTEPVPPMHLELTTNTLLDLHAFFGEGYAIPFILSDPASDHIALSSVQYGLPTSLTVSGFSLDPFFRQGFEFGDRILCRILDWNNGVIEAFVKKGKKDLKITPEDMEREEWYEHFEDAFMEKFDKHGPCRSIETQLALLFLEEQSSLCTENCGSAEEFLMHTSQIGFQDYGIESRIWRKNEAIPYMGNWNREFLQSAPLPQIGLISAEYVIDSFIKNALSKTGKLDDCDALFRIIYPEELELNEFEEKFVMLNLKKRIDIVKSGYNRFNDFPIVKLRRSVLFLFSRIVSLVCSINAINPDMDEFPQQEVIVMTQIMEHLVAMLEEIESDPARAGNDAEDMLTSLDGMTDTYEAVEPPIVQAVKKARKKNVK